uniref:AGO913 n=1 Tax=Arundo donax TaxID=35708 RepID=A0A0A9DPG4_ARUDO
MFFWPYFGAVLVPCSFFRRKDCFMPYFGGGFLGSVIFWSKSWFVLPYLLRFLCPVLLVSVIFFGFSPHFGAVFVLCSMFLVEKVWFFRLVKNTQNGAPELFCTDFGRTFTLKVSGFSAFYV